MGYVLYGVVGPAAALQLCLALTHGAVVQLGQGLSLMPMTADLFDEVQRGGAVDARFAACQMFPPGFEATIARWSVTDPVAYLEADYFGGVGTQFAAVWHHGDLVLGPVVKAAHGRSPISQALRRMGVSAAGNTDEFDAVGLGRHRHVEDWLDDAAT